GKRKDLADFNVDRLIDQSLNYLGPLNPLQRHDELLVDTEALAISRLVDATTSRGKWTGISPVLRPEK
ncbi:MAG: hypothetical protein AAGD04_14410, partial [Pseudomonadota bacterium]